MHAIYNANFPGYYEAFNRGEDLMSNETTEMPDNEWIVVFYPQTCAIRLHPTLEAARQHLSIHTFATNVYKSPLDFQKRFDHDDLEGFWTRICALADWRWPKYAKGPRLEHQDYQFPDCGTEAFTKELWALIQRVGDRVVRLSITQTRSKDHYQLNIPKMKALIASENYKKSYPKQCRAIIERMSEYDSPFQLESELERMMKALVVYGKIKTKQDAWLIFQYYRKQLMDDGLFSRGNEDSGYYDEDEAA